MSVRQTLPRFKPQFSASPTDPVPAASPLRGLPPWLTSVAQGRIRFRVRPQWSDPAAGSGIRVEVFHFNDPRKALDLVRRVTTAPDRPLIRVDLEAVARVPWAGVPLEYLRYRAEQRERRELLRRKGGQR